MIGMSTRLAILFRGLFKVSYEPDVAFWWSFVFVHDKISYLVVGSGITEIRRS